MKIKIDNIITKAVIGTTDKERKKEQIIYIDISFNYAAKAATQNDDLTLALDYAKITEHAINIAKESKCRLIETLADRILDLLKSYSTIISGSVRVRKPSALEYADEVSAETNF